LVAIVVTWLLFSAQPGLAGDGRTDNAPDWFYPAWAAEAKYNKPVAVRDTDSALGRYSRRTKEIGLKDLARIHGHLCDGLVIAFIELRAVLEKLFPNGIVDRTDLRAVARNGPCWVDAVALMTGARINFQTLRLDASIGDGFIIQRISTGAAYEVHLKPGVFPDDQAALEAKIRALRLEGQSVPPCEIDTYEAMADALSRKLLNTPPEQLLIIAARPNYTFRFSDLFGNRGDIINKDMSR
jgi:formylmethanofuran dehydrogenase subunit E